MIPAPPETAILQALEAHPQGLSREALQIASGLTQDPPYHFRRRLKALEAQGKLRGEGTTRARRYFPALPLAAPWPAPPGPYRVREPDPHEPFLSQGWVRSLETAELLARITRPLLERKPCGYDRSFLDAYQPNVTFYLPGEDRERLHALGRTPEAEAPAGTYARKILERLLIDLSWNSSRLEGNTYSLLDTERLLKEGLEAEGKAARETQMILNHKGAIEYLVDGAAELTLSGRTLRALHGLLSENLLGDSSQEGRLRKHSVGIHGCVYMPLSMPQLLEEIFEQLSLTAQEIRDPFEQAFFLLVHLPYLQPFADVNKRTARIAANLPLLKANLQPLAFIDLPVEAYTLATLAVYELRQVAALRDVFMLAYERSCERFRGARGGLGEPDPFRLRYRALLREVIPAAVRALGPPDKLRQLLAQFAEARIPAPDRPRFQALALQELRNLSDGTFPRYGLRPSEFEAWAPRQGELRKEA